MNSFLEAVAADIIRKYGNDLSNTAVVFPNKRAALFLNAHLARIAQKPIWSPAYITISDLFRQQSQLVVGDPIKLVCDLHKCFVEQTGINETLSHFYSWGQLLIADFDDIDKNMADPSQVFANLKNIHQLDNTDYLTEEQRQMLKKFFSNFTDQHSSELKRRFLQLWSRMHDIYLLFRKRLAEQNIAYEGMLYRQVAEKQEKTWPYERYLFVGFNVLQKVEQMLFRQIAEQQKAFFYWDFDHYYMNPDNEASLYISQFLSIFPNELDNNNHQLFRQFTQPKDITFASANTEDMQARYVSTWLNEKGRIEAGSRTAIVLCNESLLPTVIHCLPEKVEKVNITTAFPLLNTPISSFVLQLLQLYSNGRINKLILKQFATHPYYQFLPSPLATWKEVEETGGILPWIQQILKKIAQHLADDPLASEAIFRMYTLLNRLTALITAGDLPDDQAMLLRLVQQLIQSSSVPFHGEPAEGIQVMGVLETRNLDFDHLLLLSCNEGHLPKGINDTSFIPHSIRRAFQLTTIENKVAVYAYYFHRLLSRASDITILYNNSTEDGHPHEMSRFMLQMLVESPHPIKRIKLCSPSQLPPTKRQGGLLIVPKTGDTLQRLNKLKSRILSPTTLNRYLRCPLQFYWCDLMKLREPDDNLEVIDNRMFGNIFHHAAKTIYDRLSALHGIIQEQHIHDFLKHPEQIDLAVDEAIRHEFFKLDGQKAIPPLNGLQLLNREVIIRYLRRLLTIDARFAPLRILGTELPVQGTIELNTEISSPSKLEGVRGRVSGTLRIGGTIDRLDCLYTTDGNLKPRIRVVDYKTGSKDIQTFPTEISDIFKTENVNTKMHPDYYLQTILYSILVTDLPLAVKATGGRASLGMLPPTRELEGFSPALLFIQHTAAENYDPTLKLGKQPIVDIRIYKEEFIQHLKLLLTEIFNSEIPFEPTDDFDRCKNCPYAQLCALQKP